MPCSARAGSRQELRVDGVKPAAAFPEDALPKAMGAAAPLGEPLGSVDANANSVLRAPCPWHPWVR